METYSRFIHIFENFVFFFFPGQQQTFFKSINFAFAQSKAGWRFDAI